VNWSRSEASSDALRTTAYRSLICVAAAPGPVVGWAPRGLASVGWAR
jgi:hypothetical protein